MVVQSVLERGQRTDTYAPDFRVVIDGKQVTTQREQRSDAETITYGDVIDLNVTLDLHNPGDFGLTLNNWDVDRLDFLYSDRFELGQRVEIDLGYAGDLVRVFNGTIDSLAPSFPDGGTPTITVRGHDTMRDLANRKPQDGEKIRFPKKTDPEVAEEIATNVLRLNAKVDRQAGLPRDVIVMKNQTYAEFLAERASHIEYEFYFGVDQKAKNSPDTLYFVRRPDSGGPEPLEVFLLRWGLGTGGRGDRASKSTDAESDLAPNLISFNTSMSNTQQVKALTVRGWDPKTKRAIQQTATDTDLGGDPKARTENVAKPKSSDTVVDMTIGSADEAKKLAIALLKERRKQFATGSGKVIGLPRLQPGKVVRITGLGKRFDSDYFVTKVQHSLGGGGFLTTFDVDRPRVQARK
jgi:uncharacterized protein